MRISLNPKHVIVFSVFLGVLQKAGSTEEFVDTLNNSTNAEEEEEDDSVRRPFTIDEYVDGLLSPEEFEGEWLEGSDYIIKLKMENELIFYNVKTGENETVLQFSEITDHWLNFEIAEVLFSNDMSFALIKSESPSDWKVTPCASYLIFDLETRKSVQLHPLHPETLEVECIQLVRWTPEHGLVYVLHNNIYYMPHVNQSEIVHQLTYDGGEDSGIYNGIPAWHARSGEEDTEAMWTSPNGTYLAFLKYNESEVPIVQLPLYEDLEDSDGNVYPQYRKMRYPKAGYNISRVEVYLVNLLEEGSWTLRKVKFAETSKDDLYYTETLHWITENKFVLITENRPQTTAVFHLCRVKTLICKPIYNYTEPHGWIHELTGGVSQDGTRIIFNRPVKQEYDGRSYMHISLLNINGSEGVITSGRFSVLEMLGWDDPRHRVYYSGPYWNGVARDPSETHVYYVGDDGKGKMHCISCGLRNSAGRLCRFNSASFSYDFTYFIHHCGGPDIPEFVVRHTETGQVVTYPGPTLVNNLGLRYYLYNRITPVTKGYLIPVGQGYVARARLLFPEDVDPSKKYPLLVSVYAGPGSASITQQWETSWEKTLVSRENVVVAYIDGRGSGRQSTDFMFSVHRKLGTVEIEDQITVAKWLLQHEPLLDGEQVAIFGWSYGGYATIKVLETDTENVFKCGVSVAPVTNWRHYDATYTECYMGLPTADDNLSGYQASDVTTKEHVENLRNKELLLVHGTADETVHYQNSMLLIRSLQKSEILFEQMSYPDEGHGPFGQETSKQLYKSIERFLFRSCFKEPRKFYEPVDVESRIADESNNNLSTSE